MSADTALMPIPGPADPVTVPRKAVPRADGKVELVGLPREEIRNALEQAGLDPFQAVVEATVQRARPVILTALAAILAFIPLTHSVFWGTLAYTLIGGTFAGTVLTLVFLPAMYSIWFRIRPDGGRRRLKTQPA